MSDFRVLASNWGVDFLATQETNPDSDSHQHYNSKQYSAGVNRFLANLFCGENIDAPITEFAKRKITITCENARRIKA